MKHILILLIAFYSTNISAQNKSRFSAEINSGLNANYFVRSYDELGGPDNKKYFYKKNFIGTIQGAEIHYQLGSNASLSIGYSRSTNIGKVNYSGDMNGTDIYINDFRIRHNNDFFLFSYDRNFKKDNFRFRYQVGAVFVTMKQQEISIENFASQVVFDERNTKNSGLMEAGFFMGLQYQQKIDNNFKVGVRLRGYYLVSVQTFEAITLTPILLYNF